MKSRLIQTAMFGNTGFRWFCPIWLVLAGAVGAAAPEPLERPNILFLTTDQQWTGAVGCYGNRRVRTPAIDGLAARGTMFTRSYTANPLCSPARAVWETGRPAHQNGVWGNNLPIRPGVPTLGELFREAGYEVVWTGKRHLPIYYPRQPFPGFEILSWWNQPGYPAERLVTWGERKWPATAIGMVVDEPVADTAIEFLSRHSQTAPARRPFLLSVQLLNPHDICLEWHHRRRPFPVPTDADLPPLPRNFEISDDDRNNPILAKIRDSAIWADPCRGWDTITWRRYLYRYEQFTNAVDEQIGRVLNALDTSGCAENTLVLFTSDHGDGLAAHRWANKNSLYREAVEVPFIVAMPGRIPAGRVEEDFMVSGFDVFPTLCDYAGIETPDDLPGHSLRPVIENGNAPDRAYVVTQVTGAEIEGGGDPAVQGRKVHGRFYVYSAYADTESGAFCEQLFNTQADPGETANLLEHPDHRDALLRHREHLRHWCRSVDDPFPLPASDN